MYIYMVCVSILYSFYNPKTQWPLKFLPHDVFQDRVWNKMIPPFQFMNWNKVNQRQIYLQRSQGEKEVCH